MNLKEIEREVERIKKVISETQKRLSELSGLDRYEPKIFAETNLREGINFRAESDLTEKLEEKALIEKELRLAKESAMEKSMGLIEKQKSYPKVEKELERIFPIWEAAFSGAKEARENTVKAIMEVERISGTTMQLPSSIGADFRAFIAEFSQACKQKT